MHANNASALHTYKVVVLLISFFFSYPAFSEQNQDRAYSDEDIISGIRASLKNVIESKIADNKSSPNVILFLADDTNWFDIGPYDRLYDYTPKNAITPNIDQLAREGMMFTSAFTSTAMCSPTRQQLYTGIFPVKNGAYPNHGDAYTGTKSLVHYFKDIGYEVALAGKGHIAPQSVYPFKKIGKEAKDNSGESTFGIEAVSEFIGENKDNPYFLVIASHNTHGPWSRGDRSKYNAKTINVPSFMIDTPQFRNDLVRYYAEISDLDREVGLVENALKATGQKDNTIFIFTSEHGAGMPFAKFTTYDAGLKVAFIIRWPNKINANTRSDALIQYVDVVPTLLELANKQAPKNIDGKSFKTVILNPDLPHRDLVFGVHTTRNIRGGSNYPIRSVRDKTHKLILNLLHDSEFANSGTKGIKLGRGMLGDWYKAGLAGNKRALEKVARVTKRPKMELYNIQNDPFEEYNLIDKPGSDDIVKVLLPSLIAWMDDQGDLGVQTELEACDHTTASYKACP